MHSRRKPPRQLTNIQASQLDLNNEWSKIQRLKTHPETEKSNYDIPFNGNDQHLVQIMDHMGLNYARYQGTIDLRFPHHIQGVNIPGVNSRYNWVSCSMKLRWSPFSAIINCNLNAQLNVSKSHWRIKSTYSKLGIILSIYIHWRNPRTAPKMVGVLMRESMKCMQ